MFRLWCVQRRSARTSLKGCGKSVRNANRYFTALSWKRILTYVQNVIITCACTLVSVLSCSWTKRNRQEIGADVEPIDRLKFKDSKRYKDRLTAAQKATGEKDALIAMRGELEGIPVVAVAFEFSFMGGSMGTVVGERFARAAKVALEEDIPFICFSASGGARMQEALFSLFQMAKTSAILEKLRLQGTPYLSVLTDPVYGGVSASLAMLGDLNIAEPKALMGFAGPRVIEQTVREKLPEGFQRSEFLLEHGQVDMIINRGEMRSRLARILRKFTHMSPVEAPETVEGEVVTEADVPPTKEAE